MLAALFTCALAASPTLVAADGAGDAPQAAAAHQPGTDGRFIENYAAAVNLAKTTGRPLLIDFTGSDWCPWCIRLDHEVFATPAFTTWAAGHVVLLRADFPAEKPQDAATIAQNRDLARTWNIEGYPTVIVCDVAGKLLAQSGYLPGGADAWIQDLTQKLGTEVK
jgi:protein disulfide-isomerase